MVDLQHWLYSNGWGSPVLLYSGLIHCCLVIDGSWWSALRWWLLVVVNGLIGDISMMLNNDQSFSITWLMTADAGTQAAESREIMIHPPFFSIWSTISIARLINIFTRFCQKIKNFSTEKINIFSNDLGIHWATPQHRWPSPCQVNWRAGHPPRWRCCRWRPPMRRWPSTRRRWRCPGTIPRDRSRWLRFGTNYG